MKVTIYCHFDLMTIETELTKGEQLQKARLQDQIAGALALEGRSAVLHGGTGIWRCYSGRRFSDDIDVYIWKENKVVGMLNRLRLSGLQTFRGKVRRYNYYTVSNGATEVSIQVNEHKVNGIVKDYETVDGSYITLYILNPLSLFREKIETYADRREERDIYDIKLLTRYVDKSSVRRELANFLKGIREPSDRGSLKGIVYGEAPPNFEEIRDYLERWVKE